MYFSWKIRCEMAYQVSLLFLGHSMGGVSSLQISPSLRETFSSPGRTQYNVKEFMPIWRTEGFPQVALFRFKLNVSLKVLFKLLSIVGPVNTDSFYLAFTRTEGGQHRSIFSCRSWHASMQNGKKNCFCFIIRECVLNSRGEIVECLCLEALVWG